MNIYLVKVTKNSYKILVYAGKRLIAVLVLTGVLFFSEQLFGSVQKAEAIGVG